MMLGFMARHLPYTVKNPRHAWATVKAMRQYAKEHPVCEMTGRTPIEVHHIKPIEIAPELAADPTNFISLGARGVHLAVGHAGNWKWHIENVRELCGMAKVVRKR